MANEITMHEAIVRYRKIYRRFEKIEGRSWDAEGAVIKL